MRVSWPPTPNAACSSARGAWISSPAGNSPRSIRAIPARIAVYDFLPDALLSQVANLEDFRAILVFDKWVGNADGRQCVFYRAMVRRNDSGGGRASLWHA